MSLEAHIEKVFTVDKLKRGWSTIYWLVDVHGVIIPSSWHKANDFRFINDWCPLVLRWISDQPDQRLILWTSSFPAEGATIIEWLQKHGIHVDHYNHNPEEKNTDFADFSRKPYFNILIDDKAGFEPETDWGVIRKTLIRLGLWQTDRS